MRSERRVVVTGCGVATALGIGLDALWDGLLNSASGIRPIDFFDPSGFASRLGAQVPDVKMANYVPKPYRKSVKVMARDIELAVVCAYEAVKNAGLVTKCLVDRGEGEAPVTIPPERFGASIGAGLICADLPELAGALQTCGDHETGAFDLKQWGSEGMEKLTPLWLLKFLPNMLGCHVTIVHDCQAPSNTITCGEASSHLAIGEAFRTIARGAAEACICGGAESKMNPMGIMRQQLLDRILTGRDDEPETACCPFDPAADGMIAAEGGGLLILEELESAKARGAKIYAEVAGFGAAADTTGTCDPDPEGRAVATAIRNALSDADAKPEDVGLYAGMGSGCNKYDAFEAAGVAMALKGRKDVPALALAGAIGHNGAGSGAISLAAMSQAMRTNTIPASANTAKAETGGVLKFVQGDPVDARIDCAVGVSYAMSGSQVGAIVMKRYAE